MNPTGRNATETPLRLLPHQETLVETFFGSGSKRVLLLRADVGLGKSTVLSIVASNLLRAHPAAHVLLLAPGALCAQFVERLHGMATPAAHVDRYYFRELLDSAAGGEFWPHGMVSVLSHEFSMKPDIRESLAKTSWDLVIADEVHRFKGGRAEFLRAIGASARRVIAASSTVSVDDLHDVFPAGETTLVEWHRDQVVDHSGSRLLAFPGPVLKEVVFALSSAEMVLREEVVVLSRTLDRDARSSGRGKGYLLLRLQSSPNALESTLQRLPNRLAGSSEAGEAMESDDWEGPLDVKTMAAESQVVGGVTEVVARLLQLLEAMPTDSKLDAFGGLLNRLRAQTVPAGWICVLTEYSDTGYYLASEIENRGLGCRFIHGKMSAEDRSRALGWLADTGGILVATRGVMTEGVELPQVTDVVLYDVPADGSALQEVLGRFDRFGRTTRLAFHVLVPSDSDHGSVPEGLRSLREALGLPPGG